MGKVDVRWLADFLHISVDVVSDKINKGRENYRFLYGKEHPQHGENSKFSKLTEENVREIRRFRKDENITLRKLGEMFGVSHGVINNILQGRKWAWLK